MNRNQSSSTSTGSDARPLQIVAVAVAAGLIGSLVMPLWSVALMLLGTLFVLARLTAVQPAAVPVRVRRDPRR